MRMFYFLYVLLSSAGFLLFFPLFLFYSSITGRYREGLGERMGFFSPLTAGRLSRKKSYRIWVHAVSLGEIKVAEAVISAILKIAPESLIILSTTTEHGKALADEIFGNRFPVIHAPLDFILFVRNALFKIQPDVLVLLETEIWPAWIVEAHRKGIKIIIANGRISSRSYKRYIRFRPFIRNILSLIDLFSMRSAEDGLHIRFLGAPSNKIYINGNAKYDLLALQTDPSKEMKMRDLLGLDTSTPVIVAGSTRSGEDQLLVDAYKKILDVFPSTILIIVPRHIERSMDIKKLLKRNGFGSHLLSDLEADEKGRTGKVIIINRFGMLFDLYSICTVAFCGASLVPLGGQNPLEPAVWGKVPLYGPSMEDFLDAKALLEENNAGIEVSGPNELADKFINLLKEPDLLKAYGIRAREAVLKNRNASERHALKILSLLK